MSVASLMLKNGNLTYSPSNPNFDSDYDYPSYRMAPPDPVPAPVAAAAGGGGGWGGGFMDRHEPGMVRLSGAKSSQPLIKSIAKDIASGLHGEALKPKVSNDLESQRIAKKLRERITELEAHIRKLKALHGLEVQGLSDEVLVAQAVIDRLRDEACRLETESVRSAALAAVRERVAALSGTEKGPAPVEKLVGGILGFIAVEILIPDRFGALKDAGRTITATIAISGLAELL